MENTSRKFTKAECLTAIRPILEAARSSDFALEEPMTYEALLSFVDKELTFLANKAAAARELAAKKKVEGDMLKQRILECLTEEPQTREQIAAVLNDLNVSPAMITSRLTQLVNSDLAYKEFIEIPFGTEGKMKKVPAYSLSN